jgi:uracil-DNA glycosylase
VLEEFWKGSQGQKLVQFLQNRMARGAVIYPLTPFRALELTALPDVRVVIIGQDPYHGAGQAQGLAFSVPAACRIPPSLRNIFVELLRDPAVPEVQKVPVHGSLERWARQGVLLLNATLTVEDGMPASHAKIGWGALTSAIIARVLALPGPVVFMLWGNHAQQLFDRIAAAPLRVNQLVLRAQHPSPLSARRQPLPFVGCGHFSSTNRHLLQFARPPISWTL